MKHGHVGPILVLGPLGDAVLAAIRDENTEVAVEEHGAYLRVLCPGQCRVSRVAIERHYGSTVRLPSDLELVMPSFQGRIAISGEGAEWSATAAVSR